MKTQTLISVGLIAAFLTIASGCGKDRTVEDYQRDRVAEQKAMIRAVAGTYTGTLSLADGTSGDIQIHLAEDTQINNTRSSISTTAQASIQGSVEFVSQGTLRVLSFRNGFFDSGSGDFQAEVSIDQRSGKSTTIEISGTISGDSVDGSLAATTYLKQAGNFHAVRGDSISSGLSTGRSTAPPPAYGSRYTADVQFSDGSKRHMALVVTNTNSSSEQAFYDAFSPIKYVDAQFQDLGDANSTASSESPLCSAPFNNSTWDQRNGQLYGRLSQAGGGPDSASLTLQCQQEMHGSAMAWNCSYYSFASLIFRALFTQ